jgi:acetolactate synthase I/II/III large subunit
MMKVADYVINFLGDKGIDHIFEVYGAANGDLIDAFTRTNNTKYVSVMHEQSGGFAAEGYAKVSGKPGVAIATSGPGGHNFVTPIGNCYYDSVPAIFLTGQVNSRFLRKDLESRQLGFQETPIVDIVSPITKYAKRVLDPNSIRYELEKAYFLCQSGRPGPVLLDLPMDVQKAQINPEEQVGFDFASNKINYDIERVDEQIDSYLEDLVKSERPVFLIGAGVRLAGGMEELLDVGSKLNIPMFPTWNAFDVVTSDNPNYGGRIGTYGGKGRNFALQNSDLVLAIGSRISGRLYGGRDDLFLRGAKKYMVDVDPCSLKKEFQPVKFDENILSDAKLFLQRLSSKINSGKVPDFGDWMNHTISLRDKYDPVRSEFFLDGSPANPYAFMRVLSNEMKEGDIFLGDCGGNIVVASHAFETKKGQRFITNNGNSPMGFSFAAAIGAYLASSPEQNVACVIGDGGFNMNLQELQTIKNYGLGFKTFILNNHCYGITRQFQRTNFDGREEACGPKGYNPPNFVDICKAYQIPTVTINSNQEIKSKIRQVLDSREPIVCDVNCHDWDSYEPRVFGDAPIEDMHPFLPRDEFRRNMIIEPDKDWESRK